MKLTYYGHSCFAIETGEATLLIDPFISGNELAQSVDIDNIKPDFILVSHGHSDHIIDCVSIAKRSGAKVICSWEIHEWLNRQGVSNTHPMNTGGKWNFGPFIARCTVAQHSSGLPDGTYGGNPLGFIITAKDKNIYYSGDTALTMDMQLIPRWAVPDLAILPIGDNFTMDATDAAEAAKMVRCKKVLGVHYDTFGYIKIDHDAAREIFRKEGIELVLLDIGGTMTV